jgi:hypothetical protein
MVHGAVAIPGKTDRDEVVVTTEEIGASGLDYLALVTGTRHSRSGWRRDVRLRRCARACGGRSGSGREGLLVVLEETPSGRNVTITERPVGKTRFEKLEIDAADITAQPALIERLGRMADPTSSSTSASVVSARTSWTSIPTRSNPPSRRPS